MRVLTLSRFPVKSMTGDHPSTVDVDPRGLAGDRAWAVRDADGKLGSGKNTRRFRRMPGLLDLRAHAGDVPRVALPDGRVFAADDPAGHAAISAFLGREVTLVREDAVPHHDEGAVSIVTTAALRALPGPPVEPERFRANLLLDVPGVGFPEDGWLGRELRVGATVVLRVERPLTRCVMVDLAQGTLPERGDVLRTVAAHHDLTFGVWCTVVHGGRVRAGDPVAHA